MQCPEILILIPAIVPNSLYCQALIISRSPILIFLKKISITMYAAIVLLLAISQLVVAAATVGCNADNCLRAVRASAFPTVLGTKDCSSFFAVTVTPATQYVECLSSFNNVLTKSLQNHHFHVYGHYYTRYKVWLISRMKDKANAKTLQYCDFHVYSNNNSCYLVNSCPFFYMLLFLI
jgi:hypothetical protein